MKFYTYLLNTPYRPTRVLGISKLSSLEFLQSQNPDMKENEILLLVKEQGNDPQEILNEHRVQIDCENVLAKVLQKLDISYKITKRMYDANKCVNWADLIIPIGGDGIFLLASKLVKDNTKPVLGINPSVASATNIFAFPLKHTSDIEKVFEKLHSGEYTLLMRSRIRTVMHGEGLYGQPFHIHEKSRTQGERRIEALIRSTERRVADALQPRRRILPWLALNEVFLGEFLAPRAITLTVQIDDKEEYLVRSSGICVCTGTGSRSWYRSMNLQSAQTIQTVVALASGKKLDEKECHDILNKYHRSLLHSPDDLRMTYMIREMYHSTRLPRPSKCCPERNLCNKIKIISGGFDAGLVIDGSVSLPFNDGSSASFDIRPEYALKNIILN